MTVHREDEATLAASLTALAETLRSVTARFGGSTALPSEEEAFQRLVDAAYSNWRISHPNAPYTRADAEQALRLSETEREREQFFQRRVDAVWGNVATDDPGVTRNEVEKVLRRVH